MPSPAPGTGGGLRPLQERGHRVDAVTLRSSGADSAALQGVAEDVAVVRAAVDAASADGPGCILVGHSYGGFVITEAADHPGIAASVYVAAFWPRRGQSLMDIYNTGELPADWITVRPDGVAQVNEDPDVVRAAIANDLDDAAAEQMYARLVLQSGATLGVPAVAPERQHPTLYIVCDEDHALPPAVQQRMAEQATRVAHLQASHQPMLSRPRELVELLESAAPGQ